MAADEREVIRGEWGKIHYVFLKVVIRAFLGSDSIQDGKMRRRGNYEGPGGKFPSPFLASFPFCPLRYPY